MNDDKIIEDLASINNRQSNLIKELIHLNIINRNLTNQNDDLIRLNEDLKEQNRELANYTTKKNHIHLVYKDNKLIGLTDDMNVIYKFDNDESYMIKSYDLKIGKGKLIKI